MDINRLGVPAASEFLDVISPQYIGDLIAWGAIGARTTESQVHRELASGLSAPVGFKNGTDGNIKIAIDAIQAAARPHHFLSVHKNGQVASCRPRATRTATSSCAAARRRTTTPRAWPQPARRSRRAKLPCQLMIDASHANSSKQHQRQIEVMKDVGAQMAAGNRCIFGVMVESHLTDGAQKFSPGRTTRPSSSTARASPTPASAGTTRPPCSTTWRRR